MPNKRKLKVNLERKLSSLKKLYSTSPYYFEYLVRGGYIFVASLITDVAKGENTIRVDGYRIDDEGLDPFDSVVDRIYHKIDKSNVEEKLKNWLDNSIIDNHTKDENPIMPSPPSPEACKLVNAEIEINSHKDFWCRLSTLYQQYEIGWFSSESMANSVKLLLKEVEKVSLKNLAKRMKNEESQSIKS
jgi:hypothetical protein